MKNKQDWILENYGLCWIAVIMMILVLAFIGHRMMINYNSFTIYKNECSNVIDYDYEYCNQITEKCNWTMYIHDEFISCASQSFIDICKENNAILCYSSVFDVEGNVAGQIMIQKENKEYIVNSCRYGTKEVCNKVEVDIKSFCLEIMGEMNKDYCGREDFEKGLTKTSWLEENCECGDYKEECSWIGRARLEKCDGKPCCCNDAVGCKDTSCSKYKCWNYEVEIK